MSDRDAHYVHGTDPAEQARLTRLNALMNTASLREIGPRPGERVLDLGCGLAQLTRDLARATGVRALGIERSPEQLAEARRQAQAAGEADLVELRAGDALAPPLGEAEWGAFDLAHARFVLEHVPDPLAVARALVGAVRPGGRIVLADDDHDVLRRGPSPAGSPRYGPPTSTPIRAPVATRSWAGGWWSSCTPREPARGAVPGCGSGPVPGSPRSRTWSRTSPTSWPGPARRSSPPACSPARPWTGRSSGCASGDVCPDAALWYAMSLRRESSGHDGPAGMVDPPSGPLSLP